MKYVTIIITHQQNGVARLLAGSVFCLGLILVVVGGTELSTGNNSMVMAWASGKISFRAMMRNWKVFYLGNFVGSFGTATLMFFTRQYTFGRDAFGIEDLISFRRLLWSSSATPSFACPYGAISFLRT